MNYNKCKDERLFAKISLTRIRKMNRIPKIKHFYVSCPLINFVSPPSIPFEADIF